MLTPVECLKKEHHAIQVEIVFIKDIEKKKECRKLAKSYEVAIGVLESSIGRYFQ